MQYYSIIETENGPRVQFSTLPIEGSESYRFELSPQSEVLFETVFGTAPLKEINDMVGELASIMLQVGAQQGVTTGLQVGRTAKKKSD